MANLLLSTAYGPNVLDNPLYLITLRSWAEHRPADCKMTWIVKDVPSRFVAFCRHYGCDVAEALDGDWSTDNAGERYRHWVYANLCQKTDADWVMTIDAKDTIFQGNPFQAAWLVDKRVSVSAECAKVQECEWNFNECQSLAQSLREESPTLRGAWPVVNGGFAVGRPDLMAYFCLARIGMDVKIPLHSDQASVTYLAYATGLLNVVPPSEPWVCHGFWHDQQRPFADYALFHQWNRERVLEEARVEICGRYLTKQEAA